MNKLTTLYYPKVLSLFIFLIIDILFCIKYISRYSEHFILITVFILFIKIILLIKGGSLVRKMDLKRINLVNSIFILTITVLSILIFAKFAVDTLNVDRWSVITSFLNAFEKGEYVYSAKSDVGNPPGPMPFYFIVAYPFYLINELGWYSLLGVFAFTGLLYSQKVKPGLISIVLLIFTISPFFWWEILCRSNVFTNAALVLFSIIYFLENKNDLSVKKIVISGILWGALLSTRSVLVISYIIACVFVLKQNKIAIKQLILFIAVISVVFVVTFLPFIYNHLDEFISLNPFIVQSTFLMPIGYNIGFIVLSFVFGYWCYNEKSVYFFITLNLFLCISCYFLYQVHLIGWNEAVFGRIVDISYFIFCIPFGVFFLLKDSCLESKLE